MKDRGHCNNGMMTRTDQPNDVVQERVPNKYGPTKRKANKKCKSKPASADPEAVNQESTIRVDKQVNTSTHPCKPYRYMIPERQRDPRDPGHLGDPRYPRGPRDSGYLKVLSLFRSPVGRNIPVYGSIPPPSTRWPKNPNMQKGRNVSSTRSHTIATHEVAQKKDMCCREGKNWICVAQSRRR